MATLWHLAVWPVERERLSLVKQQPHRRETESHPNTVGIASSVPTRSLRIQPMRLLACRERDQRNGCKAVPMKGRHIPLGAKLSDGRACPEAARLQSWRSVHSVVAEHLRGFERILIEVLADLGPSRNLESV